VADTLTPGVESESGLSGDDKLLSEAQARLSLAEEAEAEIRQAALDDLEFRFGKQWPDGVENDRRVDGRPCLVINRIPQFLQQITNDQRQNRPSIKVHPVDDKGDVETAKVIQGLIRHIEYNSSADSAYDTAFDSAATGGFGYFRVVTEFASPLSFDQEILIKRIRNPFSVFFDPHSQEPDGSDAEWAFIVEDISKDEFKARYPKAKLASHGEWESIGNSAPGWVSDESARVAEYFYKDFKDAELVLLSNGHVCQKDELEAYVAEAMAMDPMVQLEVVRERSTRIPVVMWCKITANEVLERTEWSGRYIPIVPVYGTEGYINGRKILEGVVRNAKDSQRMYNYWASAETEAIALAPRTPFIVGEGQIEGYEAEWETANRRNHSYLTYKPTSVNGQPLPPPQRNSFEPAVAAITQARMMASEDLKATTGIYDAALGAKSNETSGVAIQRRNVQAQTSNFHFIDNLTRSLKHTGRILVDLIPQIYDTARAARIIGEDGEQKVVRLNEPFQDGPKQVLYALDTGTYDVTIDVGPSYASKRQEAVSSMLELSRAVPQIAAAIPDILVKNMDWPGATETAERLKKTLPPGLADDPKDQGKPLPPQVQAQMQQMNQMIEGLTAKLNEAQDSISHKRVELESKERIAFAQIQADLEIQMAKLGSQESIELMRQEIAQIEGRLSMLNYHVPITDGSDSEPAPQPMPGDPMGAEMQQGVGAIPTGGGSPGSPMEETHDDPSTF
jgi:hypothetical protein